MYGMIFRAVEGLVRRDHGEDAWLAICARVGREPEPFVQMQTYPDALLVELVGAASAQLGVPPEAVMHGFGRFWIEYTAATGYGNLLDLCGSTFEDFLEGLDDMHARISLMMPHLEPPGFDLERGADGALRLHYRSHRRGFEPVVGGLLEALAERFGVRLNTTWSVEGDSGDEHTVFALRLERGAGRARDVA